MNLGRGRAAYLTPATHPLTLTPFRPLLSGPNVSGSIVVTSSACIAITRDFETNTIPCSRIGVIERRCPRASSERANHRFSSRQPSRASYIRAYWSVEASARMLRAIAALRLARIHLKRFDASSCACVACNAVQPCDRDHRHTGTAFSLQLHPDSTAHVGSILRYLKRAYRSQST